MSDCLHVLMLYRGAGPGMFLRTLQRWYAGSPFAHVERFVPREGLILDLGCGWGVFANLLALAAPARQVMGIDADARKIAVALRTVGARANVRFERGDVRDCVIPPCDAVVMYDLLHHLPDDAVDRALDASYRALGPAGTLVIKETDTTPRWKVGVARLVEAIALRGRYTLSASVRFRTRADWRRTLERHGFALRHEEHVRTPYGFFVPHSLFICCRQADRPDVGDSLDPECPLPVASRPGGTR